MKTVLDRDGQKKIQVNATFPFEVDRGRFTFEVPFGMLEYGKENPFSKSCHPTVRAINNWIDISNDSMGITLATEVIPFDVKDRIDNRFHDARTIDGKMEKTPSQWKDILNHSAGLLFRIRCFLKPTLLFNRYF